MAEYEKNSFVVLNISDPATPTLTGHYNTTGSPADVVIKGSYAYVANGDNGLLVLNISDPTTPKFAGQYDTTGSSYSVKVEGNYAYVADQTSGLVIVNISDPSNPTSTGHYDTTGNAYDVTIEGNYAYIANEYNLVILNISDPANPTIAGQYDTKGYAYGVRVEGNYVYVADWTNGLVILHVINENMPMVTTPMANPTTIESDGSDTVNLSAVVTNGFSGIDKVTIDLSAIGGPSNAIMANTEDTYWLITNATGVGSSTCYLPLNATANSGDSNTSVNITLHLTDTTSPIFLDNTPLNGTNNLTPTISVNVKEVGSGINFSSANMVVNEVQVALENTSLGYTHNFTSITGTSYNHSDTVNVIFSISDNDENVNNVSWMFYIDNINPRINITSYTSTIDTTASSLDVSGTVNGTGSPPNVSVNGVPATVTINNSTYSGTFASTVPLSIGLNTIYANVTDKAGNINSTFINVTKLSDGGNGGSNSGSGGGGATGEAFDNILVKDAATSFVVAGEVSKYEFSEEKCHIIYIQFKGLSNAGQISTLIEILKDTSALVDSQAPGIVYQNMNIWVGNAAFGDDKIEDAVIGFRISKEWISENRIDASTIALYHYSDGKWNKLFTNNIAEDDEHIYFEAETFGFSPFAIVGFEEDKSVSIQHRTPSLEEDISTVEDEDTQPEPKGIPWISTGLLILILVGVHLLMRERS